LGLGGSFLDEGLNAGLDVVVIILGFADGNNIGHNLDGTVGTGDGSALHDLDLEAEDTLTEFDVTDGNIDEIVLGLTGGDLVTSSVLLGLCALTTDLSRDHNFATSGATTAHDGTNNVVSSVTDGGAVKELVLKVLNVSGGRKGLGERESLNGELNAVLLVVEAVALLDKRLEFLNLLERFVEEFLVTSGENTDFGLHVGSTDLNTTVTLKGECLHEELVELSFENTISDELALG
jgi:hypothetical protein